MNGFLLDTNVLSALRRPAQNRAVVECIRVQPADLLHTSTVNIAEIRYGIELKEDPVLRADLMSWLANSVIPLFDDRVHEVWDDVLLRWLFIIKEGQARGHTYAHQDSLIAAVAAINRLIVITADETHFVQAGVSTLDPWRSIYWDADGDDRLVRNLVSATLINELGS